ncbi:SDR family NAD(P)-dependent oxidoreductase [Arthrobacter sp. 31Y]|uniref:SDR family NAD(P)-dependent oxidoreductase n=1 Tax=Arthrobacter sp. 31Y TaxID=1115632 RepID=UPI0004B8D4FC|nr:SDR family NAD(P)-dependent oxidoreductase [Arthrobacter sp. 31Y]
MSEAVSTGRSVLITGGNRGIGLAIAESFLANGDKVAVTYRSESALPDGILGVKAMSRTRHQLTLPSRSWEEAHGPVEVLVANAGITKGHAAAANERGRLHVSSGHHLTGAFRVINALRRA